MDKNEQIKELGLNGIFCTEPEHRTLVDDIRAAVFERADHAEAMTLARELGEHYLGLSYDNPVDLADHLVPSDYDGMFLDFTPSDAKNIETLAKEREAKVVHSKARDASEKGDIIETYRQLVRAEKLGNKGTEEFRRTTLERAKEEGSLEPTEELATLAYELMRAKLDLPAEETTEDDHLPPRKKLELIQETYDGKVAERAIKGLKGGSTWGGRYEDSYFRGTLGPLSLTLTTVNHHVDDDGLQLTCSEIDNLYHQAVQNNTRKRVKMIADTGDPEVFKKHIEGLVKNGKDFQQFHDEDMREWMPQRMYEKLWNSSKITKRQSSMPPYEEMVPAD